MSASQLKIYVFYYKKGSVLELNQIYQPIMSGNSLQEIKNEFQGDDTGENISHKNKYYSELTGIYWVWKNTRQDITGTCHYRRYFTAQPEPFLYQLKRLLYFPIGILNKRFGLIYTKNTKFFAPKIIDKTEIEFLLQKYDAILPQARKLKYTVETHFKKYHDINDLNLVESIIKEKQPEFLEAFHEVLKGKRLYANNMFILKDKHFQEFMTWWFDILFTFEQRTDLSKYTGYQQRIFGFIGERLLNVWFRKKQLKCIELPVIYFKHFKFE
jgi:hypothetical protein